MNEGHRKRLRERFLKSNIEALHDYEIIELLLTLGTPRKDCKNQAKEAIKKFKSLKGVLDAPLEELQKIKGIGPHNIFGIKLFQELSSLYSKLKIEGEKINCSSSKLVAEYLLKKLQKERREIFVVLFLDAKNKLIKDEELFKGGLISSPVFPREIIRKVILYNAASIILAHNHPSGDTTPSVSDKEITKNIKDACNLVNINVLDHIIVGDNKYYSFADNGMI